jgi:hypothetical protein
MGIGMSSRSASPAERKGVSPHATRPVYAPEVVESGGLGLSVFALPATQAALDARPILPSERPATLRCARSGGPGPSAAGRAPATGGSRTTGGAVVVRFAVEAVACGAVGCRESAGLVELVRDGEQRVLCPAHAAGWSA